MNLRRPYFFSDGEGWDDIPSWDNIVADWTSRMQAAGADVSVNDLPLVGPNLSWHSFLDIMDGTWLPIKTLAKMKAANAANLSLLREGERFAFADPTAEFPYVPAGALDIAKILVDHNEIKTFAAAMIAASAFRAPTSLKNPNTSIHRIGQMAFAHLETIGIETRFLLGMNRKKWLPVHHIEQTPDTYGEAIALLVDEHVAVLQNFRPVRLVPYVQGPDGVVPVAQQEIQIATDDLKSEVGRAMFEFASSMDGATARDIDRSARQPSFRNDAEKTRYELALDFFNQTISAAGQNPARYARLPRRIDIGTKAQSRKAFQITLYRYEEPWEQIRDAEQSFEDSWLTFTYHTEEDNAEAAKLIRAFVSTYESALEESEQARQQGRDPAAVREGEVKISHLTQRALELSNIEIGKELTIKRDRWHQWNIIAQLEFQHPLGFSSGFSIKDGVLCFDKLRLPCSKYGGITIEYSEPDHVSIIIPRPVNLPEQGDLNAHLKSSALEGLPSLLIADATLQSDYTHVKLDPKSPALAER